LAPSPSPSPSPISKLSIFFQSSQDIETKGTYSLDWNVILYIGCGANLLQRNLNCEK
jgi:hypothetical protein